MTVKDLLKKNIRWKNHPDKEIKRYWYCQIEEKLILLRMNNFPDEVLFTVINGLEICDLEDKPENWELEE
jgi:hypothetical protein